MNLDHLNRHLLFVSALWVALMMVLLCAMLPAGLPLTKTVGSAFSPSTTIVALKGRAEQVRGPVKRLVKGDPDPATGVALTPGHQVFVTSGIAAAEPPPAGQQSAPISYGPAQPVSAAVTGRPYPRGPPIA